MASQPNRFFHGFCANVGNLRSHFSKFIIETAHDITDYEGGTILETVSKMEDYYFNDERIGEPYYLIHGCLKPDFKQNVKFIAAFESLKQAIDLVEHLTGNEVIETEVPVYK
jgi:hypothetical protein